MSELVYICAVLVEVVVVRTDAFVSPDALRTSGGTRDDEENFGKGREDEVEA